MAKKYYYLATNRWGHGRSLEPGNGWDVTAYEDEETRDRVYDRLDYIETGCIIPSQQDIIDIFGTEDWGISAVIIDEDGGHDCEP